AARGASGARPAGEARVSRKVRARAGCGYAAACSLRAGRKRCSPGGFSILCRSRSERSEASGRSLREPRSEGASRLWLGHGLLPRARTVSLERRAELLRPPLLFAAFELVLCLRHVGREVA